MKKLIEKHLLSNGVDTGVLKAPDYLEQISFPWVLESKLKELLENDEYQLFISTPYYKTHKKPTKEQWKQIKLKQQNTGIIIKGENVSSPVKTINNYFRELKYDLSLGNVPKGKYTIPASIISAFVLGNIPAAIGAGVEGYIGGKAVDTGSKLFTGKSWSLNIQNWTGLDPEPAEMTNLGSLIGGLAGYSGVKTLLRGIAQDIESGVKNNLIKGLFKGSPNLGNAGLLDKNNPMYHWGNGLYIGAISEIGNHIVPFLGPGKTPMRWVLKNVMSQSSSPERSSLSLKSLFTEKSTDKDGYNGVIGFLDSDLKKLYPNIDFNRYYLWRTDPILRWSPKVRATAQYFKDNPTSVEVQFGPKYDLYGKTPKAKMPTKSVLSHIEEAAEGFPDPKPILKTENGITEEGLKLILESNVGKRLNYKFKLNEWEPMNETLNPDIPELNVGGHQIFVDSNTGKIISKDIWKFNPQDWKRWKFLQGKASQAGILDKLGKPFITVSENKLSPEAMLYLLKIK